MKEKLIKSTIETITVPEEAVTQAIQLGISKGTSKQFRIKKRIKWVSFVAVAIAFIGISGFIVPSVAQVLADIPGVGKLYQKFGDPFGAELTKDAPALGTVENEQFILQVLGAYYDTSRVGIVYQVVDKKASDGQSIETLHPKIPEINGQAIKGEVIPDLKQNDEQDNVYDGYFLINLSDENLPKNLTIPLEIETPSGKLATDISLEQLPTKGQAMDVHQTVETNQGLYQATITKVTKGREVSVIDYQVSQPKGTGIRAAWANFQLFTKDQQQEYIVPKELSGALVEQYTTATEDVASYRAIIPNKMSDTDLELDYANLHVNIEVANELVALAIVGLNEQFPKTFGAENDPYQLTIERIEKKQDEFKIALQFANLPESYGKEQLEHNLNDNFHVGTKKYLEAGSSADFEEFETPEEFYIKYGKINQLEYQASKGWVVNLSYNIADTHGWGKYFETATFDKSRAYFGGSLRPSSVVFDPMTLNIEK